MSVSIEQATVYRGGRRRWFSIDAACRAEARLRLQQSCECEKGDSVTPGYVCRFHGNNYEKYVRRLARIALHNIKRGKQS